jgi:glutamate--cysteine ligase
LLCCALQESPPFADSGWCPESASNFASVVKQGRQPGLQLKSQGKELALAAWAEQLLEQIGLCAETLDGALVDNHYAQSVSAQREKILHSEATPSARILADLKSSGVSYQDYALKQSSAHAQTLRQVGLTAAERALAFKQAEQSLKDQEALEAGDTEGFDEYVARFHRALKPPTRG